MNPVNEISNDSNDQPHILLMEDEPLLAQGFQMILKEEGFVVDLAMTGRDALDTMARKGYDLVVADLRLPDMDGMEVIKRVKDDNPETRVIVITGYANVASALEAFQTGVCDYLAKPLSEEVFMDAVNDALQKKWGHCPEDHLFSAETGKQNLLWKKDVIRALNSAEDNGDVVMHGENTGRAPGFSTAHEVSESHATKADSKNAAEVCADMPDLFHQDKMISLGRLAASVVHEINNPLSGILNYIRLMIKIMNRNRVPVPGETEKFMRYLTLVEAEVSRCSSIVSSLLAFSRKTEVQHGEVNIGELLHKCILLCQHKLDLEGLLVKTRIDSSVPDVRGDFNQIQQCVINLIFNAIDAMDKGGTLSLACTRNAAGDMVEIQVGDDGCGIAEKDRSRIFEPFFTTKNEGKGLGLGLSTVCKIVDQHKGTISVESELGKGTTFIIRLPVLQVS